MNHLNTTHGQNTHTSDEPRQRSDGRFTVATSLREVNILAVLPPSPQPTHEQALSLESQRDRGHVPIVNYVRTLG